MTSDWVKLTNFGIQSAVFNIHQLGDFNTDDYGADHQPCGRENAAICYDGNSSRILLFGGWANQWLDDVWQLKVGPTFKFDL